MSDTTPRTTTLRTGSAGSAGVPADATGRLPWLSLLVLGGATFTMVTAEMLPAAVLPQMSAGLGVSEPQVGLLVSVWAAVVVIGSFPLVRLTRRFDRRAVIAGSLVLLAASAALTAIAPDYPAAVAARLLGALAVGLLWATTNAFTADLVSDRNLARAVAVVLGGATLGTVLGIPAGSVVADAIGWRAAFGGLAALALVAAVLVRVVVRTPGAGGSGGVSGAGAAGAASGASPVRSGETDAADADAGARTAAGRGIRRLIVVTMLVALLLVGHFGTFTFITRLVESPAGAVPGGVGTMLFVFGLASAAGVVLAGRFGDRTEPALLVSAVMTGAAVLALSFVDVHPALGVTVLVAWAVASGAVPALAQTLILRLAGPAHRGFAGALIPVLFNLGIAVGAALASLVVGGAGVAALPPLAAAVIGAAGVGLWFGVRSRRRGVQSDAPSRRTTSAA
ncbi:MFS transporter [Agromyces sp. ZXT2-6]|uniref:MFS transporter n=1 Tax=Agromyces sp. ZXT2-6 TaxID=3461153 RepID=UPI0040552AD8